MWTKIRIELVAFDVNVIYTDDNNDAIDLSEILVLYVAIFN